MKVDEVHDLLNSIIDEINKIIVGRNDIIKLMVTALFSRGHVLINGPPGTAKTYMAKSLAKVIGGKYRRIQGNPDVLPSDITGFHLYTLQGTSKFIEGPVFANIVLVDEINRITPRSQSALLEAMQEKQVTVDGVSYPLRDPFLIIATQIPIPLGTGIYPLIETLSDRFALSANSGYGSLDMEYEIIRRAEIIDPDNLRTLVDTGKVVEITNFIMNNVYVDEKVKRYIAELIHKTRINKGVVYGPSPRVSMHLYNASKVYAVLNGRDYVIPDDVKDLFIPVASHRVFISSELEAEGYTVNKLLQEVLNEVPVPKE